MQCELFHKKKKKKLERQNYEHTILWSNYKKYSDYDTSNKMINMSQAYVIRAVTLIKTSHHTKPRPQNGDATLKRRNFKALLL